MISGGNAVFFSNALDVYLSTPAGLSFVAGTGTPDPDGNGMLSLGETRADVDGETVIFPAHDGSGARARHRAR